MRLTLGLAPLVGDVVVCSAGGQPFEAALDSAGVRVEHIPRPRPTPVHLLRAARALARVLRHERPMSCMRTIRPRGLPLRSRADSPAGLRSPS